MGLKLHGGRIQRINCRITNANMFLEVRSCFSISVSRALASLQLIYWVIVISWVIERSVSAGEGFIEWLPLGRSPGCF
jgi:hypothetical protein